MLKLHMLTAALLASSDLISFAPNAETNSGGKFYVCATAQADDLTLIEYEALAWVEVKNVGSIGETGTQQNVLNYDTWGDKVTLKSKGMSNAGDPAVEVARKATDPGQLIMRTAAASNAHYAFKLELNDKPDVDGTGTTFYNRGIVTGPTRPNGRNEDFVLEVYTLGLDQLEIIVEADAGA